MSNHGVCGACGQPLPSGSPRRRRAPAAEAPSAAPLEGCWPPVQTGETVEGAVIMGGALLVGSPARLRDEDEWGVRIEWPEDEPLPEVGVIFADVLVRSRAGREWRRHCEVVARFSTREGVEVLLCREWREPRPDSPRRSPARGMGRGHGGSFTPAPEQPPLEDGFEPF